MRHFIRTTALAAALLAAFPAAQAATQTYSFHGALDSGVFTTQTFSGQFSFDDTGLTNAGEEYLGVGSLNMSFLGNTWNFTHLDSGATAEVKFYDGVFAGLSYSATQAGTGFSAITGTFDSTDAFVAYTTSSSAGAGNIIYAPVPEPETYAMLLAGLGLMGAVARRRRA